MSDRRRPGKNSRRKASNPPRLRKVERDEFDPNAHRARFDDDHDWQDEQERERA